LAITLGFDVYGTLIDTHGVVTQLQTIVGSAAMDVSQCWRQKQLEFTFRRGLMAQYVDFSTCTREALDYTNEVMKLALTAEQKGQLLSAYLTLPAFSDVAKGLQALQKQGVNLFAFSNGTAQGVEAVLQASGIDQYFIDIVSVDAIKTFKPDPAVYEYFLAKTNAPINDAWLVSSNPFDISGARAVGLNAAWVQRSEDQIFDPCGEGPNIVVKDLIALTQSLKLV
jgi:2-haloacid dehalogenase